MLTYGDGMRRPLRAVVPVALAVALTGCVVDDPVGARAEEQVGAGVERVEGAVYDAATDTWTVEREIDLDGRKTETDELVETMRGRDR